ncbi:MAG TPA: hypothetical protein ENJ32_11855 [Crenotrichaceae bacterium]|nr:hypothetical protein [Crenotrichaceae bacterium]
MQISTNVEPFIQHRNLLFVRGLFLSVVGFCVFVLSVINPELTIMSSPNWLPVIAFTLIVTGILESIDSIVARKTTLFLIYTNLAIVDLVTGIIILFELYTHPKSLVLLTTAFLFIKGLFRIVAALNTRQPNYKALIITGVISLILGLVLWQGVPENHAVTFISICIAIDLTIRGIALLSFSLWLRTLNKSSVNQ